MLRYGHYPILVGDNASLLVPATLGELNALCCPGRQYHTGILQIATNAIDAAAKLHNDHLNNISLKRCMFLLKHILLMPATPRCTMK